MTPPQDASAFRTPDHYDPAASIRLPKRGDSPSGIRRPSTISSRRSNSSLHSLYASTTFSSSNLSSGSATPTASVIQGSVFSPGSRHNGTQSPVNAPVGGPDEPKNLILRGFAPRVAVHTSKDVDELLHDKGFSGGLLELLRPYGEHIPGKITIRDSVGVSRSYEDFGVRFAALTDGLVPPVMPGRRSTEGPNGNQAGVRIPPQAIRTGGDIEQIEEVVERHLQYSEEQSHSFVGDYLNQGILSRPTDNSKSAFHTLYLRRLLSGLPMVPHETFGHPVACVLAISSRHPDPIDEMRNLYNSTSTGDRRPPQWVDQDFLRYYVLVHDQDRDGDRLKKSQDLHDQMKRHFGLHCHLLVLRSNQCIPSDDDAVSHPQSEWISAAEELAEIQKRGTIISSRQVIVIL